MDLMPCLPAELEYMGFAKCFPSAAVATGPVAAAAAEATTQDSVCVYAVL